MRIRKSVRFMVVSLFLGILVSFLVVTDIQEKDRFSNFLNLKKSFITIPAAQSVNLSQEALANVLLQVADETNIVIEKNGSIRHENGEIAIRYYNFATLSAFSKYFKISMYRNDSGFLATKNMGHADQSGTIYDLFFNDDVALGLLKDYYRTNRSSGTVAIYCQDNEAKQKFVDLLAQKLSIDPAALSSKITKNVSQIEPHWLYGAIVIPMWLLLIVVMFDFLSKTKEIAIRGMMGWHASRIVTQYLKSLNKNSGIAMALSAFIVAIVGGWELSLLGAFLSLNGLGLLLANGLIVILAQCVVKLKLGELIKERKANFLALVLNYVCYFAVYTGTLGVLFVILMISGEIQTQTARIQSFKDYGYLMTINTINPSYKGNVYLFSKEIDADYVSLYRELYHYDPSSVIYADFAMFNCKWVTDRPCTSNKHYKAMVNDTYLKLFDLDHLVRKDSLKQQILVPKTLLEQTDEIVDEEMERLALKRGDFEVIYYDGGVFPTLSPDVAMLDGFRVENPILRILDETHIETYHLLSFGNGTLTPMKIKTNNGKETWYQDALPILQKLTLDGTIDLKGIDRIDDTFLHEIHDYETVRLMIGGVLGLLIGNLILFTLQVVGLYILDNQRKNAIRGLFGFGQYRKFKGVYHSLLIIGMCSSSLSFLIEGIAIENKVLCVGLVGAVASLIVAVACFNRNVSDAIVKEIKGEAQ